MIKPTAAQHSVSFGFRLTGAPTANSAASLRAALPIAARALAVLNAKFRNTGVPIFAGIDPAEKRRRRAAGKRQRAARRAHRRR